MFGFLANQPERSPRRRLRFPVRVAQHPFEMIGLRDGGESITRGEQRFEKESPPALTRGLRITRPPCQLACLAELPLCEPTPHHPFRRPQEHQPQSIALDIGPLLELETARYGKGRQEVTRVLAHRVVETAAIDGIEKLRPVESQLDAQHQIPIGRLEGLGADALPDIPDSLTQGVFGRFGLQVRPEKIEQVFAAGGAPWRACQIRDHGKWLSRSQHRLGTAAVA